MKSLSGHSIVKLFQICKRSQAIIYSSTQIQSRSYYWSEMHLFSNFHSQTPEKTLFY
jgi:hypothetical protein